MFRYFFILLIKVYQKALSPILPPACRFYPSCSSYAVQTLGKYSLFKSSVLIIKRISKCHPFHEGGIDQVP